LKLGYSLDHVKVLSIGTGSPTMHKGAFTSQQLGLTGWGTGIIEWIFHAQSHGTCNMSAYALGDRFKRIDSPLPPAKRFLFGKYGLDKIGGTSDLIAFAERRAKETFVEVQRNFLIDKAEAFTPEP
jgi:hypothetical protein